MRFSIAIPNLNQGAFLGEAIESVVSQVEKGQVEVDLMVVDGGSNDCSQAVLEGWKQKLAQTPVAGFHFSYHCGPDTGQTQAINRGLENATGDVLAYLCADDFYEPGALSAVAAVFGDHPQIGVVYGDAFFLEGRSGWKRLKCAGGFSIDRLRALNFLMQPATFWRRSVWQNTGPFDESLRFCMDNEYWLRIGDSTQWYYLERALATMRLHRDAKTSRALVAAWDETAAMAQRYGLGEHYQSLARRMKRGGALWYATKRWIFERVGLMRGLCKFP